MSASLPQSIALAGLLWLLFMAPIAGVLARRGMGPPRVRVALLPALSSIAAMTLMTWAGHAIAGTRGVALGIMVLLFATFALFARLHAVDRSRLACTGARPREPTRSV